jgi:tripartite-type tricarboxylate transporter receptor subunit TctC
MTQQSKFGTTRRRLLQWGTVLGVTGTARTVSGQAQYPNRPIRLIVPFAAGGSTDVVGRLVAQHLGAHFGSSVFVENRGGAAGVLGCVEAARSPADGYTLLMGTTGTHAINPTSMGRPAYDAVKDFTPIASVGTQPMSICVHPSVRVETLKDLIAMLKADPGKHSYASAGNGGIAHLTFELFKDLAGKLESVHIPYRGGAPALQDVISGHVPILADTFSSTLPYHQQKLLRVIVMTGEKRSPLAPDIPTGVEAGLPGLVASTSGLLLGPAGLPDSVMRPLRGAFDVLMKAPEFQKKLIELNFEPATDWSPEATGRFISSEIAKWAPVVRSTGTVMN